MTIKSKILLGLILAVTIPVISTSVLVSRQSSELIFQSTQKSLDAVTKNKANAVESYFKTIKHQVQTFSENKMVVDAASYLSGEFETFVDDNELSGEDIEEQRKQLSQYYFGQFNKQYAEQNNGDTFDVKTVVSQLPPTAVALQYQYIFENENPLGSKHLLDRALNDGSKSGLATQYGAVHERIHPVVRSYLEKFGYYDIFIADAKTGNIIYSVFKELDYATSVLDGPYKDSGIGQAFRTARSYTDNDSVVLTDYAKYSPSYEAPASFVASPIIKDGETIAVAIFQMPIDRLNEIMKNNEGLGETGESYLVGQDLLPRSNSLHDSKYRSINAAFRNPEKAKMKSTSIEKGLAGETGIELTTNYLGEAVISDFVPIKILNHRWVLVAEITEEEAFASVNALMEWMIISALIIIAIATVIGWYSGSKLGKSIEENVTELGEQTKHLEESVDSMTLETEQLSENVVRSASAVQETASSLSEINSTLKTNSEIVDRVVGKANDVLSQLKGADSQLHLMNGSFTQIGEGVQKNNEIIDLVEEISDKTKMINEIVFKTQLLAVNASIEAARAGEQGKGFAVVADEVTKLATLSGEAAEQIDKLIGNSRKIIVGIVKDNQGIVDHSQESVSDFRALFETMTTDIRNVLEATKDIANATHEQKQGVIQVSTAMDEIDSAVQKNQEQTQASRNLADNIRDITISLKSVLGELERVTKGSSGAKHLASPKIEHDSHKSQVQEGPDVSADDDSFKPAA